MQEYFRQQKAAFDQKFNDYDTKFVRADPEEHIQHRLKLFSFCNSPQDDLYNCIICMAPAIRPIVCSNADCDQIYCQPCCDQLRAGMNKCARCQKAPLTTNKLTRMLRVTIEKAKAVCDCGQVMLYENMI